MMGADVQIPCSFTVNKPPVEHKYLKIVWRFQGKEILSIQSKKVKETDPRVSYIDRAIDGIADLTISNISLSDGGMYTCSVLYSPERKEKEIRLDIQAPPQITITDKTVLINKESVLRSSITGFYPEHIVIEWFRDEEILNRVTVDKMQRSPNGMYSVNSSVIITPTEEDRERIFSCRVQHQSLNGPLQEDFQLVYGVAPSISITSPKFMLNVEETLVCHVSGFYPESIAVNWLMNGTMVENTKSRHFTSSSMESVYQFLPTEQNWGTEISCVVEHDTLIHPHVERLLVVEKDLKARYKVHVVIVAIVLVCELGTAIIVVLLHRYRKSRLPKVRNIICSTDGRLSMNVDHFYPKDISVCWAVIQPPSSAKHETLESTDIMEENQDGTFSATSSCETLRDKVNVNEPYIVRAAVTHQKLKHPLHKEWDSEKSDIKCKCHWGILR
ncbi:tyrosine-protein phosphatase non-receptor type substrate 1-like [Mixophyes fleayi]|uniref:tyrosine-protein phosphatase non-receptor type substrate 1-like n=1 Tax=Mixophyes fleayi TaxID=3061075 RepID=UPI003F4DCBFA